jgi:hypothetical protein
MLQSHGSKVELNPCFIVRRAIQGGWKVQRGAEFSCEVKVLDDSEACYSRRATRHYMRQPSNCSDSSE